MKKISELVAIANARLLHNHFNCVILFNEGSQSQFIELLQQQLSEKEAEIEQLKTSKLVYKRPIRQRIEEVKL